MSAATRSHELEGWIKQRLKEQRKRGEKPEHIHRTRMVPKRAAELIDGGSIYWVIRGEIACRQRIRDVGPFATKTASGVAVIVLDPKVVLVASAAVSRLPRVALPRGQRCPARSRQGRTRGGGDAGKITPGAARTRSHVSRAAASEPTTRIAQPKAIT